MALRLEPSTTFTTTIQDSSTANRSITWPNSNGVVASIVNSTSFITNFTSAHTANRTIALPDRDCELTDGLIRISDTSQILINRSSIVFNIPAYAKYASIVYNDVSTTTAGFPIVRLTPVGLPTVTTGYVSTAGAFRSTVRTLLSRVDGFPLTPGAQNDYFYTGVCELHNLGSNMWMFSAIYRIYGPYDIVGQSIGYISLQTTLASLNFTLTTGVFDSGTVNAFYK